MTMQLVIGNKNYSSWSLRPWLLLRANSIPFTEVRIPLYTDTSRAQILALSPAGRVPILIDEHIKVWDSLAICEYISETRLGGAGWPIDSAARAEARACSAEMHAGFQGLRNHMPMNCRAQNRRIALTPELQTEISRIDQLWSGLRDKYQRLGPWLFGKFSIADCMFAPVVFRFKTYAIELSVDANQYMATSLQHPAMQEWLKAAIDEEEVIRENEAGLDKPLDALLS